MWRHSNGTVKNRMAGGGCSRKPCRSQPNPFFSFCCHGLESQDQLVCVRSEFLLYSTLALALVASVMAELVYVHGHSCVCSYKCECAHVYGHLCLCMCMAMCAGCVWRPEVNAGYPFSAVVCLVIWRRNHSFRTYGCLIWVGRWRGNPRGPLSLSS